jgi:hypothetical protein
MFACGCPSVPRLYKPENEQELKPLKISFDLLEYDEFTNRKLTFDEYVKCSQENYFELFHGYGPLFISISSS